MEPLAAVGLATSVLTFIDFGCKVVKGIKEIQASADGTTKEGQSATVLASQTKKLAASLAATIDDDKATEEERDLALIAQECEKVATDILGVLAKSKAKSNRRLASVVASLSAIRHKGELKELEFRLDRHRDQLHLQLNYLKSADFQSRLDKFVTGLGEDVLSLTELAEERRDVHRQAMRLLKEPRADEAATSLLEVSNKAARVILQHYVVECLRTTDMFTRSHAIEEAHKETFSWILSDDKSGDHDVDSATECSSSNSASDPNPRAFPILPSTAMDDTRSSARSEFQSWLSSGSGIFHIAGKLGSGKSTLMKFLSGHHRTRSLLEEWAGCHKLVSANYFFWRFGSALHSSLSGLVQSLLYEVLNSVPDMAPSVFPWLLEKATNDPAVVHSPFRIRDPKTIFDGFTRLVSSNELLQEYRFCFFIDGLDEYNETLNYDHKRLVSLLISWATSSQGRVKICVSSREHNVYLQAFKNFPRLRLQDLTRSDMEAYVADRLQDLENFTDRMRLTTSLVGYAEGIFLWVALVTKRIREHYDNGYTDIDSLLKELETLPRELEDLYAHILNELPPFERRRAYMTFAMMTFKHATIKYPVIPQICYSFLENYLADPTFAMAAIEQGEIRQPSPEEVQLRLTESNQRLNGCCKGLVVLGRPKYSAPWAPGFSELAFTHRSVPEFVIPRLDKELDAGFDAADAVSNITLAALAVNLGILHDSFERAMWCRLVAHTDLAPDRFLDAFATAGLPLRQQEIKKWPGTDEPPIDTDDLRYFENCEGNEILQHPIYLAATSAPGLGYVRRRLLRGLEHRERFAPCLATLLGRITFSMAEFDLSAFNKSEVERTLDLLMELGLNAETQVRVTIPMAPVPHTSVTYEGPWATPWEYAIFACFFWGYLCSQEGRNQLWTAALMLERFLETGVDRRVRCNWSPGFPVVITAGSN